MLIKTASICLLAALAGVLLPGGNTWAAPREAPGMPGAAPHETIAPSLAALAEERVRISLDQAAAMVRQQTGGRIIKAATRSQNGRLVHHIRVLTRDGRVFTVRVDAASGRRL